MPELHRTHILRYRTYQHFGNIIHVNDARWHVQYPALDRIHATTAHKTNRCETTSRTRHTRGPSRPHSHHTRMSFVLPKSPRLLERHRAPTVFIRCPSSFHDLHVPRCIAKDYDAYMQHVHGHVLTTNCDGPRRCASAAQNEAAGVYSASYTSDTWPCLSPCSP